MTLGPGVVPNDSDPGREIPKEWDNPSTQALVVVIF